MAALHDRERALIVAPDDERRPLADLFAGDELPGWEALEARSFEAAHFILQHVICEVLLLDHSLFGPGASEDLAWLRGWPDVPVVLLAGAEPALVVAALERGVHQWLPRDQALAHPDLLLGALNQARRWSELARQARRAGEALHECRRQISRLVGLLWETTPVDPRTRWLTQRHMLERLQEEVARAERYHTPLAVVLGEVQPGPPEDGPPARPISAWTADRITRTKRRSDVAGRYGPNGFLLLLTHTPEAGAVSCCQRLKADLEQPPNPLTASFGVASFSPQLASATSLLSRAEECLQQARAGGDNRVVS